MVSYEVNEAKTNLSIITEQQITKSVQIIEKADLEKEKTIKKEELAKIQFLLDKFK